jgi:hypothetical protein
VEWLCYRGGEEAGAGQIGIMPNILDVACNSNISERIAIANTSEFKKIHFVRVKSRIHGDSANLAPGSKKVGLSLNFTI